MLLLPPECLWVDSQQPVFVARKSGACCFAAAKKSCTSAHMSFDGRLLFSCSVMCAGAHPPALTLRHLSLCPIAGCVLSNSKALSRQQSDQNLACSGLQEACIILVESLAHMWSHVAPSSTCSSPRTTIFTGVAQPQG